MRSLRTAPKTLLGQLVVAVNRHEHRQELRRILNTLSLRPAERRVLLAALSRDDPEWRRRVAEYERAARRGLANARMSEDGHALAQAVLDLLGAV